MIEIKNTNRFGKVVADALVKIETNHAITSGDKIRWINAIAKASFRLQATGVFMTWQEETDVLLIWSESNNIYEAGKTCHCLASESGKPCWHIAAKKLYKNYLEIENKRIFPSKEEMENAPLIRPTLPVVEVPGSTYKNGVERRGNTRI